MILNLDEIRRAVDVTVAFDGAIGLKEGTGGRLSALCPWHDDHSPSLSICADDSDARGVLYCWSCGKGGTVFDLAMEVFGFEFAAAVQFLAESAGVAVEYDDGGAPAYVVPDGTAERVYAMNAEAANFFTLNLTHPEAEPARRLLEDRGFPVGDAVDAFGVGYALNEYSELVDHLTGLGFTEEQIVEAGLAGTSESGKTYDRFRGRLVWPIRNVKGMILGFGGRTLVGDKAKFLNPTETPVYRKRDAFYGVDRARETIRATRTVTIVEGYMDVMACHASGVDNAVAVNGTAFGTDHAKALRRLVGEWGDVCIAMDADDAGIKAATRVAVILAAQGVTSITRMEYPAGQDACDVYSVDGPDALHALYTSRRPFLNSLVSTIPDTVRGRTELLEQVRALVKATPNQFLRAEMVDTAARAFNLAPAAILSAATERNLRAVTAERAAASTSRATQAEWDAAAALFHSPDIPFDPDWFQDEECREAMRCLKAGEPLPTATQARFVLTAGKDPRPLVEYVRYRYLDRLAMNALNEGAPIDVLVALVEDRDRGLDED